MRVERLRILAGYHAYPLVVSCQMESWYGAGTSFAAYPFGLNLFEVCSTVNWNCPLLFCCWLVPNGCKIDSVQRRNLNNFDCTEELVTNRSWKITLMSLRAPPSFCHCRHTYYAVRATSLTCSSIDRPNNPRRVRELNSVSFYYRIEEGFLLQISNLQEPWCMQMKQWRDDEGEVAYHMQQLQYMQ